MFIELTEEDTGKKHLFNLDKVSKAEDTRYGCAIRYDDNVDYVKETYDEVKDLIRQGELCKS